MKATKFFQLMAVCYSELTPGSAVGWSSVGATYVFVSLRIFAYNARRYLLFDADIQPPSELRDFELPANSLPPLTSPIGSGASSEVYKVANFLPTKTRDQFLAVKRFPLSLERGLAEHAEDFRRFKLELFISSRLQHPNIVKTFGATLGL